MKRISFNGGTPEQLKDLSTVGYNISNSNLSAAYSSSYSGGIGLAVDSNGNKYTLGYTSTSSSSSAHRIIKLDASNNYSASVLTGGTSTGSQDGTGTAALFQSITDIALDASNGDIFVIDGYINAKLRKVSSNGVVTT